MKTLLIISLVFSSIYCNSQVKVYIGNQKLQSNLIYQIENKIAYRVNNIASKIDFLYIDGDKVYLKDRKFFTDIKYTVLNNSIFKGSSTSVFDILFTFKDDKIYIGNSDFRSDCLYTFKDGVIYRGDSTSLFDAFMSYEVQTSAELIYVAMLILPY